MHTKCHKKDPDWFTMKVRYEPIANTKAKLWPRDRPTIVDAGTPIQAQTWHYNYYGIMQLLMEQPL